MSIADLIRWVDPQHLTTVPLVGRVHPTVIYPTVPVLPLADLTKEGGLVERCRHTIDQLQEHSLRQQLATAQATIQALRQQLKSLTDEVNSYTTERQYHSRSEASADLDRREKLLLAELAKAQAALAGEEAIDTKRFEQAPCYICGYNGPGYYQPETHACAARYHRRDQP